MVSAEGWTVLALLVASGRGYDYGQAPSAPYPGSAFLPAARWPPAPAQAGQGVYAPPPPVQAYAPPPPPVPSYGSLPYYPPPPTPPQVSYPQQPPVPAAAAQPPYPQTTPVFSPAAVPAPPTPTSPPAPASTPPPSPSCKAANPSFSSAPHGLTRLENQNTGYWFSWSDSANAQKTWTEAERFCRLNCMTLVSLDQTNKTAAVAAMMTKADLFGLWTSGHVCNYAGCDKDPQSNGKWMWATKGTKVGGDPTGKWSPTGGLKKPQPDNLSGTSGGENEDCLALLNNWYNDGTTYHDFPCSESLPFVCEKSLA